MNRQQSWLELSMAPPAIRKQVYTLMADRDSPLPLESILADLETRNAGWQSPELRICAKRVRDRCRECGATLLTVEQPQYPSLLRTLFDPPLVLFTKSRSDPRNAPSLAVVGSRRCNEYGKRIAYRMAYQLAASGFTIVSGMALGIDTAAHLGAIEAGGQTWAVLGSGLAEPYPPENRLLMDKIAETGAVMTEYAPDIPPRGRQFPVRNRLISGMSLGVVVVQASPRSGALLTAGRALEQGREVFAVPGPIDDPYSEGCNRLIQQGAKLVLGLSDIVEELQGSLKPSPEPVVGSNEPSAQPCMDHECRLLYDHLSAIPRSIDDLAQRSGMAPETITMRLTELELLGMIRHLVGKGFVKT